MLLGKKKRQYKTILIGIEKNKAEGKEAFTIDETINGPTAKGIVKRLEKDGYKVSRYRLKCAGPVCVVDLREIEK